VPTTDPLPGRSARLVNQIILGTETADVFQMHAAIVAALELYSIPDAIQRIFRPAIDHLTDTPSRAQRARSAVAAHIATYTAAQADRSRFRSVRSFGTPDTAAGAGRFSNHGVARRPRVAVMLADEPA
jgi:hypothetical protein